MKGLSGNDFINTGNQNEKVIRLVKLRNPWGKLEWRGPWCDQDKRWSSKLRSALKMESKNDGIFYMDLDNFMQYFRDVQVCFFHDNYKYSAINLAEEKNGELFISLKSKTSQLAYLSLNQINKRFFPPKSGYNYSPLKLLVFKKDESIKQILYVTSSVVCDKENWVSIDLSPG